MTTMMRFFLKFALVFGFLGLAALSASALQQSQVPAKFPIPWANSAGVPYITFPIPTPSQIGVVNCRASLTDGFPPLTFSPQNAGGCPPFGQDFNGILKMLSLWSQWQGAAAPVFYDSAFSASIGGYPKGASLSNASSTGCWWISTVDNNTSDPDTGGANWNYSCPGGGIGGASTGTANAQAVTTTPIALTAGGVPQTGTTISYTVGSGLTNTGALVLNVNGIGNENFYRLSQLGATMSVGGETVAGQRVMATWDGSEWICQSCGTAMVGSSQDFFGSSTPNGWLFEDGSCVSQTTYADLYTVIGTTYGSCSAGNFALPDTRGRTLVAQDNQGTQGAANRLTSGGSGCPGTARGTGCGSQNEALSSTNQLPQFTPTGTINFPSGATAGSSEGSEGSANPVTVILGPALALNSSTVTFSGTAVGSASPSPFTTVQPTLVATKMIKF